MPRIAQIEGPRSDRILRPDERLDVRPYAVKFWHPLDLSIVNAVYYCSAGCCLIEFPCHPEYCHCVRANGVAA